MEPHGMKNSSKGLSGEEGINLNNENGQDKLLGRYHSFEGSAYSQPKCKSDNTNKKAMAISASMI